MPALFLWGGCLTTIYFPPDLWQWTATGDTGRQWLGLSSTALPTTEPSGPALPDVTAVIWGCDAERTAWTWEVHTDGWAGPSQLDLFASDGTSETHDLVSVASDPNGAWDALHAGPLADGALPADQRPNVDTRFDCDAPDGVSFALRMRDIDGVLTDCVVGGADPAVATAGARRLDPEVELDRCDLWDGGPTTVTPTR